jgi:two-component system response regulator RstA
MPRVLIVEDDQRLAELLAELLGHEGFEVTVEHDGRRASERILTERPDVVVLDHMLPGESGLGVLKRVRPQYSGGVIMLTARAGEIDQVLGLELGADDYIAKPASPRVLLARIRALLRRGSQPEEPRTGVVLDLAAREVRVDGVKVELTTAEIDLLEVLVRHAGQPVSREALVQALRGIEYDGLDRSIDMRVSALRKKLRVRPDAPDRIKTVRGVGYQLVVERGVRARASGRRAVEEG